MSAPAPVPDHRKPTQLSVRLRRSGTDVKTSLVLGTKKELRCWGSWGVAWSYLVNPGSSLHPLEKDRGPRTHRLSSNASSPPHTLFNHTTIPMLSPWLVRSPQCRTPCQHTPLSTKYEVMFDWAPSSYLIGLSSTCFCHGVWVPPRIHTSQRSPSLLRRTWFAWMGLTGWLACLQASCLSWWH